MNVVPCPLQIRANCGHSRGGICDAARGFVIPDGFVEECFHGSKLAFCDSIASIGLIAGGLAGSSKRANCHFSIMDWRKAKPEDYNYPKPFDGPQKVPLMLFIFSTSNV